MSANITIAEIARNAGVGTATVDRVLNGRTGVNSETERKVLQAIDNLGTPIVTRGRPRSKENWKFAYVLPDLQSPYLNQLERHIAQTAGDFRHGDKAIDEHQQFEFFRLQGGLRTVQLGNGQVGQLVDIVSVDRGQVSGRIGRRLGHVGGFAE